MKPRPEPEEPQQEMPPAPAPAPPPLAKERCDWSSKPIVGSMEGHNIGGKHNGKTLSECQLICDAESSCKSIDYSASKKRCYLGDCVLGGECENSGNEKYKIYGSAPAPVKKEVSMLQHDAEDAEDADDAEDAKKVTAPIVNASVASHLKI